MLYVLELIECFWKLSHNLESLIEVKLDNKAVAKFFLQYSIASIFGLVENTDFNKTV